MILLQKKIPYKSSSLYLVASEKGLCSVHNKKQKVCFFQGNENLKKIERILKRAEKQLMDYFEGKRKFFEISLDIQGTEFQKKVWNELSKIPYGKTKSYQDIAFKLKNGKASRAVGTAIGKNPVWIFIPCHRVISSNGSLGGYAGGLNMKRKLLTLERENIYAD